ncbi:hypothetical protein G7054_g9364 [Neopestalotiopsis clavispora]|nr:hypothetical protein G7054_g9364 [Neopestalotiopsis clavispora]
MKGFSAASGLAIGASLFSGALAADASWQTIPSITANGQHFFYSNNGTQFLLKGVAYQENFSPNGSSDANVQYKDPLADGSSCARDIPFMKQIFTNVIRVYAIDPTQDHDDCMQQLAAADIYVVADLSQPGESINSNDPEWNVPLYTRYTSVVDALAKYQNVIGFFAGNEVISAGNQTAAAAFVKAAVRDTKSYIKSMNYRDSLGVGYATADVPGRDQLAAYFACEPDDTTSSSIDFWGYNVYSWCGDSNYVSSSYNERVEFFSDYPVPVFFAEYGCIEGIPSPDERPFTEVEVLYGNMTEVFSGGIVYQWFWSENEYGLISLDGNTVSTKADYNSLSSQLAKVTPSLTQSADYTPSNKAPACPTTGSVAADVTWLPQSSPLPPNVNPQLCSCEEASFGCVVSTDDEDKYADAFAFICGEEDGKYCDAIAHNASTGTYGAISGCDPKVQLGFVANQYYLAQNSDKQACDFNGVAKVQGASTAASCSALISQAGTDGLGTVASATGQQGTAAASTSSVGVPGFNTPSLFGFGNAFFVAYMVAMVVSGVGMIVL